MIRNLLFPFLFLLAFGLVICKENNASDKDITQAEEESNEEESDTGIEIEKKTESSNYSSNSKLSGNTKIYSFNRSKNLLMKIYEKHRITFYCGCKFYEDKRVDPEECGYVPKKSSNKRSRNIEWEHVVAAENFGRSFKEWREGHPNCVSKEKPYKGRRCASKVSEEFRRMEADMHNLHPAIGELNQYRSNYMYNMIPGEEREFGKCDFEVKGKIAEPMPSIYGNIARTFMYMDKAYPRRGIISGSNRKLFEAWNRMDPVDKWECERARLIKEIQGNENSIVEEACKKAGL
ncbi:MAG: endonuclease [Leptospiraceae bacterium]|nr:endonuclease [Leptospiraceae bacterium]